MIEQLQRRATKFILNDYESDYYDHLLRLNLLPIMYTSELADIVFAIKFMKAPSSNFDITSTFTAGSTRSAAQGKLKYVTMPNNKQGTHILIDFFNFGISSLPLTCLSVSTNRISFYGHTSYQTLNLTTLVVTTLCVHAANALTFPISQILSN